MFKRRGKSRRTAGDQLKFLKLLPRSRESSDDNIGLSNFDACIEASDSLAASPPSTEEFEDCSIFISPDGALLESEELKKSLSINENLGENRSEEGVECDHK